MARVRCACGNTITDQRVPLPEARYLFTGPEADEMFGSRFLYDLGLGGYECPRCKRLLFFTDGGQRRIVYTLESDGAPDGA
jgi:hypothetical protein